MPSSEAIKLKWLSSTPLGLPEVPEPKHTTAVCLRLSSWVRLNTGSLLSEKKSFGYCNWITRLFRNWLQRTHAEEILLNSEWPRMIISCVRALKYSSELNLLSREVGGQRRQPLVCILKSNVRNRLWCLERLWDCQRSDLFTQNQSLNLTHATVAPVQSAAWMS